MKNMSPKVTRPAPLVTRTVNNNTRTSHPMAGNEGPCCTPAPKAERAPGISKDVQVSASRTVYAAGFNCT